MQALREVAREFGETLSEVKRANPQVHGIEIDYDRTWLAAWRLSRVVPEETWKQLDQDVARHPWLPYPFPEGDEPRWPLPALGPTDELLRLAIR